MGDWVFRKESLEMRIALLEIFFVKMGNFGEKESVSWFGWDFFLP